MIADASARRVLALTMWGEARGEGLTGMAAVGCVIRNRVLHPRVRWWGVGWEGVCRKPAQFSCWNPDDPNEPLLSSPAGPPPGDKEWIIAQRLAAEIPDGLFPDITRGADHYHNNRVSPPWSHNQPVVAVIGRHRFYRLH